MLDTIVKIAGIVVTAINTIVRVADILLRIKDRHQKSNRHCPK